MPHFIWVYNICQGTYLGGFITQGVNKKYFYFPFNRGGGGGEARGGGGPGGGGGGGREIFRASLYVWCLRYGALCDDLVVFKL